MLSRVHQSRGPFLRQTDVNGIWRDTKEVLMRELSMVEGRRRKGGNMTTIYCLLVVMVHTWWADHRLRNDHSFVLLPHINAFIGGTTALLEKTTVAQKVFY